MKVHATSQLPGEVALQEPRAETLALYFSRGRATTLCPVDQELLIAGITLNPPAHLKNTVIA